MAVGEQPTCPRPVYIVEQNAKGEGSTIHVQHGAYPGSQGNAQSAPVGGRPQQVAKPTPEEKNPVELRYDQLMNARIGRWFSAAIVLGLAAGIISKHPGKLLLAASAINIAIAGIHLFPLGPAAKPIAANNVRPPNWFLIVLSISTLVWIAGTSLMFAVVSTDDKYAIFDPSRHVARGVGTLIGAGTGTLALLENITIACGCMGGSALICCFYQWYIIWRISSDKFEAADIRKAFSA